MGLLTRAIREEQWEVAARCLLLAALRAVNRLPPNVVVGLLEVLEGGDHAPKRTP